MFVINICVICIKHMFYSPEILSIKNKTSLALLFYISTTSNKSKKVKKKDIEAIDIFNAIVTLKHPPEPFALKLYSILIKGLVRIYSYQIRYCESETNLFYKLITIKKQKNTVQKTKKIDLRLNKDLAPTNNFLVDFEEVKISNFFAPDMFSEPKSIETLILNDQTSNNFEPADFLSDIEINRFSIPETRIIKRIIDKRTELPDDEECQQTKKTKLQKDVNPIYNILVCQKLQQLLKGQKIRHPVSDSNPEMIRNQSTLSFLPQTSTSQLNDDLVFCDNNSFVSESFDRSVNFAELAVSEFNFTAYVQGYTKKEKAMSFLKLLSFCKDEDVQVTQDSPFGDIKIIKSDT